MHYLSRSPGGVVDRWRLRARRAATVFLIVVMCSGRLTLD